MGNDEFILYIRKQYPNCESHTDELGRLIWIWIEGHDSRASQIKKDLKCFWQTDVDAKNIDEKRLPKTATQFEFDRKILPDLYDYLDTLGRNN